MPLLVVLGCRAEEAIVLVAVSATAQAVTGLIVLRRHVRWGRALLMTALASLAVPLGVAALALVAEHDHDTVRRVFGAVVLTALAVYLVLRPEPRERLPRVALPGAMLASGFLSGFCGMSGPPAVLWVMAHKWSAAESRATLWALFGGLTPVQILVLRHQFGDSVVDATGLAFALVPASVLGVVPGLWIGHRIPKNRLRTLAFVLLAAMGLYAVIGAG